MENQNNQANQNNSNDKKRSKYDIALLVCLSISVASNVLLLILQIIKLVRG